MAITEFSAALNQVASERNISPEVVLTTLKEALIAAYNKDNVVEETDEVEARIDPDTGEVKIFVNGKDATPSGFGRIASQTAKQVILQQIREAEKRSIAHEYRELIGTMTQGYIFRIDKDTVVMDIGKAQGLLTPTEKIPSERYSMNQKYKVLIKEVTDENVPGGAVIILSRKDPAFIAALLSQEVPEMEKGVVKIESIAREAGERTKIAVSSSDPKIDPSGACIGQRGVRVQAVTDELNGEKIDIINYSPDADRFIAAALAPAHVIDVKLDLELRSAFVKVSDDQLSLAIGNNGQNVRLAAKLTGWKINIEGTEVQVEAESDTESKVDSETESDGKSKSKSGLKTKSKSKSKPKAKSKSKSKSE